MERANPRHRQRPIPAWRRRYPSDMAAARQSKPDQSVNAEDGPGRRPRRSPAILTSPFKTRVIAGVLLRFGCLLQVFHASAWPGFHPCHRAGCPTRCGPGLRHQAEDTRDRIREKTASGHFGDLPGFHRRIRPRHFRSVVQGTHRHQDRYPAAEIRQHRNQLHLRTDVQRGPRPHSDRRSADRQLLLAGQRQSRLFHRTQSHFCAGPAAGQAT